MNTKEVEEMKNEVYNLIDKASALANAIEVQQRFLRNNNDEAISVAMACGDREAYNKAWACNDSLRRQEAQWSMVSDMIDAVLDKL